jgi:hypothetical protein
MRLSEHDLLPPCCQRLITPLTQLPQFEGGLQYF